MAYLLDTNVIITYIRGRSASLKARMDSTPDKATFVCSVVKQELIYGSMRSRQVDANLAAQAAVLSRFRSLEFNDVAANIAGREQARLAKLGTPIGPHDLQIAGIALANNLTLVTHNVREFERINDLRLEDWEG